MRMEEIWWTRLINSVRFLEDTRDVLLGGKSVVMNFPGEVPWQEFMTDALEQHLFPITDERSFEVHDVSEYVLDPGLYLFNNFCNEAERGKYWPATHGSYEKFLAVNDNIKLNHRIVCITGVDPMYSLKWVKSLNEYIANKNSDQRGIFILITQKTKQICYDYMEIIDFEDYVSDYDCRMLCLTLLSSVKCTSGHKRYIAEIAAGIAKNNVEKAGILASAGMNLAVNPYETALKVYKENGLSVDGLEECVNSAVWSAQIRIVFPELEEFRRSMINKYGGDLTRYLPVTNTLGERIVKAADLEIGQIFLLCTLHKVISNPSDKANLALMRKFRNLLAHCDTIPYAHLSTWL